MATLLRHGDLLPCAFLGDYGKDSFILPQSPLLLPHYYMDSGRLQLAETRSTKRVRRMPQNSVATGRYYNIFICCFLIVYLYSIFLALLSLWKGNHETELNSFTFCILEDVFIICILVYTSLCLLYTSLLYAENYILLSF